ncbi:MAG TPA: purine-nucleoside phosphorylase [Candidatus Baltobacteraceae bacterium]
MNALELAHDVDVLARATGGEIDVAIVLGSGLSDALSQHASFARVPYAQLRGMPQAPLAGHADEALVGSWHGKRVLAFAGRVHLYQGFTAAHVTYNVALAAACGAKTLILTNAAGGLNPQFAAGDLMLVADHINLTGTNPLVGDASPDPFVDMADAYSPRLRAIARASDDGAERPLHEGVYAGLVGPSYETPAETRYLRTIGADAVGMSTVLETIAARQRKLEVLGISLITNVVGAPEISHAEVTAVARTSAPRLANIIAGVIHSS